MNKSLFAVLIAAMSAPGFPALAQSNPQDPTYRPESGDAERADRSRDRGDARFADRNSGREWRQYRNYDHDRPEDGQSDYDASRYYRDHPSYTNRTLSSDDRVYRGGDSRYYCRRSDGTTGLIIGGLGGGLLGNVIAPRGSGLLGTVLGAGGGALAGRAVDRKVTCR